MLDYIYYLEKIEVWYCLDESVELFNFYFVIVFKGEMLELCRIKDVVRKGYVFVIDEDRIVFIKGMVLIYFSILYVDCIVCVFICRLFVLIF